jgi:hypothetical protein
MRGRARRGRVQPTTSLPSSGFGVAVGSSRTIIRPVGVPLRAFMSFMIRSTLSAITPVRLKGVLDYYRFPHYLNGLVGPFNGQCGRQQLFVDIIRTVPFSVIIETGTHRGTTTEYFARETRLPTYSVEADARSHYYAGRRLRRFPNVTLSLGDSRRFLRSLCVELSDQELPFVYLDAHWGPDLPLAEEVELLTSRFRLYVIMIDDFRVPGDAGYGFDSYGEGRVLTLEYLHSVIGTSDICVAYPQLPSVRESGLKRGCLVLFAYGLRPQMEAIPSLRCAFLGDRETYSKTRTVS